ncbi:MAG: hypothetical protein NC203_02280 [Firmicutes bacterium]|nr:hypothetical protein [[Eubacterium] siraeum]MCM1487172.1 hypothetical protein [Bacillota bacterium]
MKTDREMTASLLQRREEYIREKAKRNAHCRMISHIAAPVCAAAAVVTVLSISGNIFTPASQGKNISLVEGSGALPVLSDPPQDGNGAKWYKSEIEAANNYYSQELSARELLSIPPEELGGYGISTVSNISVPEAIVCENVICKYTDAYVSLEDLADGDTDIMFVPSGTAAICAGTDSDLDKIEISYVTTFNIGSSEWLSAILINGRLEIYEKERSAGIEINGTVYQATAMISDDVYFVRRDITDQNDEYTAFELSTAGKREYLIARSDSSELSGWLCFESYPAPEEEYLSTDYYGCVMDTGERIREYVYKIDSGELDYNYYNIYGTTEYVEALIDVFSYNGAQYQLTDTGYTSDYNPEELYQWGTLTVASNRYTVFMVNRSTDRLALIQKGTLTYFDKVYANVEYSVSIKSLSRDELTQIVMSVFRGETADLVYSEYEKYGYYNGIYNIQFYYQSDDGEDFALVISAYDDEFEEISDVKLVNMNTKEDLDVVAEFENIDRFIYGD